MSIEAAMAAKTYFENEASRVVLIVSQTTMTEEQKQLVQAISAETDKEKAQEQFFKLSSDIFGFASEALDQALFVTRGHLVGMNREEFDDYLKWTTSVYSRMSASCTSRLTLLVKQVQLQNSKNTPKLPYLFSGGTTGEA